MPTNNESTTPPPADRVAAYIAEMNARREAAPSPLARPAGLQLRVLRGQAQAQAQAEPEPPKAA